MLSFPQRIKTSDLSAFFSLSVSNSIIGSSSLKSFIDSSGIIFISSALMAKATRFFSPRLSVHSSISPNPNKVNPCRSNTDFKSSGE